MPEGFLLNARAIAMLKKDHQLLHSQLSMLRAGIATQPNNTIRQRENATLVKVTEMITGRTTTQLGSGKAEVWNVDDDGKLEDAARDELDIYNDSLIPIPVDSYIRVSRNFRSGLWMPSMEVQTAIAKTTGGISARSGTTAGSGTVDVYYLTSAGVLTNTGKTVSAYNIAGGNVNGSTFITIKRVEGSPFWVVDMEDCG
jgi:hypothetical protein